MRNFCRSQQNVILQNECFFAKVDFSTDENEPSKVWCHGITRYYYNAWILLVEPSVLISFSSSCFACKIASIPPRPLTLPLALPLLLPLLRL